MSAKLLLSDGRRHGLECVRVSIGRSDDSDVRLPADDALASRAHCELCYRDGAFWVHDLGSANGTFVNEERVAGPVALRQGDVVRCGASRMVFLAATDGSVPRPAPTAPAIPSSTPPAAILAPGPPLTQDVPKRFDPPPPVLGATPVPSADMWVPSTTPPIAAADLPRHDRLPPAPASPPLPVALPHVVPDVPTPRGQTGPGPDLRVPIGVALALGLGSVFLPWSAGKVWVFQFSGSLWDYVHLVVRHVLRAGVPLEGKMLRVLVTVVMPLVALLVTSGLLGTRDLRRSAVVPCAGLGLVSALLFYTLMRGGLLPGLDFGRYLGIGFWLFVASYVGLLGFGLDQRGARRA